MVVDQQQPGRIRQQRGLEHVAGMDDRAVQRPGRDDMDADQVVFRCQV
jgi:hypothetical protein